MFKFAILALSFFVILLLPRADALRCYQCGTTAETDECIDDYEGFVNTSLGLTDKYAKDCTAANVNWTRCMIMTEEGQRGVQLLFHRGCHDGVTFSKLYEDQRFLGLPANNQTTCARITSTAAKEFVCFRFCDTDFCNGPQPPPQPVDSCRSSNNANATNGTDVRDCDPNGLNMVHGTTTLVGILSVVVFSLICLGDL